MLARMSTSVDFPADSLSNQMKTHYYLILFEAAKLLPFISIVAYEIQVEVQLLLRARNFKPVYLPRIPVTAAKLPFE